ncbi:ankyrin repeat domain-containing protein [Flavilitoribacter nigricans]|uniref:Uncharacterized protein n=1 Tax=Flavilitoribacter nigricans (strain ATCC 23147 / DSM 23189 / NBRC 102662 / NCIMB 1420 / SS-2) TaxID=1122177 RepID=A0A2D0N9Q7_FLAN2|nr:ankyrin repeat domain-containing protein [Flavilitoribacter nigricans]PHN04869.1 hypothetical protein CRP01_20395 [Flavilitoribacter nigricans DSM 23189 = NBRC 102662]
MQSPEALVNAVQSGNMEQVKMLVEQQPELIHSQTNAGIPITLLAAYYRKTPIFEWLMSRRDDPNIYEAAVAGQQERVEALLEASPELLDAHGSDGFTPLALTCYFAQYPIAKLLVDRGADVNLIASNGSRIAPLHSAVAANSLEITRLLLENGAEVGLSQHGGVTALHTAAHRGNVPIVELLLEHGADPTLKMDDGRTPLDFARADGHQEVVKILTAASE